MPAKMFPISAGDPLDFEAALTLGNGCVAKDTISVIIDNNIWLGYTADWNSNTNWCGGIPIFGSKVFPQRDGIYIIVA